MEESGYGVIVKRQRDLFNSGETRHMAFRERQLDVLRKAIHGNRSLIAS